MLTKDGSELDLKKMPYMEYATGIPMFQGELWKVYKNKGGDNEFSKGKVVLALVRPVSDPIPFEREGEHPKPDDLFKTRPKLIMVVIDENGRWSISALPYEALEDIKALEDAPPKYEAPEIPDWGKANDMSEPSLVKPNTVYYDLLEPERALPIIGEFCGCGATDVKTAVRKIQRLYSQSEDEQDSLRANILRPFSPVGTDTFYGG